MSTPLTVENFAPLAKEWEDRMKAHVDTLLKDYPKVNGVVTADQIAEMFKQEGEKLKKDVLAMVPANMREAIVDALRPQDTATLKANAAVRFALTNKPKAVLASKELNDKATELGLLTMDQNIRAKALGVATGATMGFLVPTEARGPILELERKFSVMQSICPVMDNPPARWTQPREKTGMTFYWNQENTAPTKSSPALDLLMFSLTDVTGLTQISNMLLQWAAFDVTGYISRLFGRDLAVELDTKFVAGTGSGQPTGFAVTAGLNAASQAKPALDWQDFNTMWHSMNAKYRNRAVWMAHDTIIAGIENIPSQMGGPLFYDLSDPSVRGIGNVTAQDPMVSGIIKRRPLYQSDDLTTSQLALFVPDFYQIALGAVEIASSEEVGFDDNSTHIRLVCYAEGKFTMPEAGTLMTNVVL
jgi:HK97 family phage major capsid protein